MAFFARSPKKKPSPKKYAKDWKAESDAETDAAARLNKVMAKLEGITPERDEKSLEAAYALTQAVADVSLGDVWSEIRRACARGVARVPLDGPRRARLAAVFSGQLRVTTDWRRADGLCTALKGLATHEPSPPCAALHDALLAAAIVRYQDPMEADKILKIQRELDETKVVLHKTIDSVLARGEKLDNLVDKSTDLSLASQMFYKQAKKQNQCCTMM